MYPQYESRQLSNKNRMYKANRTDFGNSTEFKNLSIEKKKKTGAEEITIIDSWEL